MFLLHRNSVLARQLFELLNNLLFNLSNNQLWHNILISWSAINDSRSRPGRQMKTLGLKKQRAQYKCTLARGFRRCNSVAVRLAALPWYFMSVPVKKSHLQPAR